MRRPRCLPLALLVGLAAACGGGGGGGGSPTPPTPDPDEQTARQVLEDCAHPTLVSFLEFLDGLTDGLDPAATAPRLPDFTALQGTPATSVAWTLDLDGDQTADLAGSVRFTNAQGVSIVPFDLSQLLPAGTRLADFLGQLPDGTRVVLPFASAAAGNANGQWTATVQGGAVTRVSGNATVTRTDCSGTWLFTNVAFGDVRGTFPAMPVELSVTADAGLLLGELALDGTNTAFVTVRLNAKPEEFAFFLDVVSGSAIVAP